MTSEDARRPTVDELAELDAGLVDDVEVDASTAARLRAEATRDPRSDEVLDALATTRAELAAAPLPEAPPVERWAVLFAEPGTETPEVPVVTTLPVRRSRTRPALVAAAVLVAVAVVVGVVQARAAPAVSRVQLVGVAQAAVGVRDAAGLDDPARRAGCLRAAAPQLAADAPLLGARRVDYEGRPGVLLVLGTGRLGSFTVVVVDPGCGPGAGTSMSLVTFP